MDKKQKAFLWFDPEGDHIEVSFGSRQGEGDIMHTDDERIMLRVDDEGRIIGIMLFSVDSFMGDRKPHKLQATPQKGKLTRTKRQPNPRM